MSMGSGSPPNAACAACKFQRRKCTAECSLAPWFPPDQPKRFANVHRLFGVSNVVKLFSATPKAKRNDLVKSIVYEADARERDLVHGAYGTLQLLEHREIQLERERNRLRSIYEAMLVEEAKQAPYLGLFQSSSAPVPLQLHTSAQYNNGSISMGGATPLYVDPNPPSIGPLWDLSVPVSSTHAASEQPQQIDWIQPYTHSGHAHALYSGHGYSVSMHTNVQQLPPAGQQQFHSAAPILQLHSSDSTSATQECVRDFLSQGLRNNQSFFPR